MKMPLGNSFSPDKKPSEEKSLGEQVMKNLGTYEVPYVINPGTPDERTLMIRSEQGYFTVTDGDDVVFETYKTGAKSNGWILIRQMGHINDEPASPYRRKGIATKVYDLLEAEVKRLGGQGVMPHFGGLSDEGQAFWKGWIHKKFPDLDQDFINDLVSVPERTFDPAVDDFDNHLAHILYREHVYAKLFGGTYEGITKKGVEILKKENITLQNMPPELTPDCLQSKN